ncbi:MAG: intradiol ring-cleavage dioxygenase [Gammaproteobacteria bacterium]|nr:intradiol ring-cleavage dioxygenase [Gammaproteobacteria bacterium]
MHPTRRLLLKAAPIIITPTAWAATPTVPATSGPFYPAEIPLDSDADLTMVKGKTRPATGIIANLTGKLTDINGCPVRDAKIEIWQCDAFGAYHHPRDRGDIAEPEFQGYGTTQTTESGEYRFKTITPVSYPGRTPHIHVRVSKSGMKALTTQLYVKNEPRNEKDFLFNRIPSEYREQHTAVFPTVNEGTEKSNPNFDIVLGQTIDCA